MSSFTSSVDLVMAARIEFSLPFHGSSGVSISLLCAPFLRKISTLWFLVADLFSLDGGGMMQRDLRRMDRVSC